MKSHTYKELSTAAVFTAAVVLFSAGFSAALLLLGCLCPGIYKIGKGLALINSESYFFTKGDIDTVTEGAMKGIAEYLPDGYSAYFTEEEYDALLEGESGISIGIGIVLEETATGFFTVTEVYDNTPASDSGLLVQDRIVSVNGECAEDMSLEDFIRFFHVGDGEDNLITVERNGEELSISVTAKEYYVPYAEYEMIDEKTGYLRIKSFHGKVTDDVSKSLDEMQTLGMKQLVIDVRDNLGGLLSDALDIADLFLPEGTVITKIRDAKGHEKVYRAVKNSLDIPVIVLINAYSASASELFASALRDNGRAVLVGEKTYGKGIVQTYFELPGDDGVFKLTTEAYYTPADVCIHESGLEPDVSVSLSADAVEDLQLEAALELFEEQ